MPYFRFVLFLLYRILVTQTSPTYVWAPDQRVVVDAWFRGVGERKPGETIGELAVRAGKMRIGTPYLDAQQIDAAESLSIELETLQCQSFVESSLSIARCVANLTPTPECFAREIEDLRYRDGEVNGYASRLHYFNDWLIDNTRRGAIVMLSEGMQTSPWTQRVDYMTMHQKRYPALAHPEVLAEIGAAEARLSETAYRIIPKDRISGIESELQTGDVIAFVSSRKPGLMISHTGLVVRAVDGSLKLMHASSFHKKVVLTKADLTGYMHSRPERIGIMVARPLPLVRKTDVTTTARTTK
ncbi:MAG: DUF1460 domain-containing protein [Clostridia bacterium]|nr:DUF1460 domain-containing protein [Deltaproteobacteria bacterium]